MKKPVPIALIVTLEDERDALINPKPIEAAGGAPVILPYYNREEPIGSVLDCVGGILLAGGRDVDPGFYNEAPHPKLQEVEPLRDPIEFRIIRRAMERDMPILGVCRGIQTLNVTVGGTLFQDIPSVLQTDVEHGRSWDSALDPDNTQQHHTIDINPSSRLFEIIKTKSLAVNSYHHQSIKDLAPGFEVSARCRDGVIEGVESSVHRFVLGIQCHIELLWEKDSRWLDLYKTFIKASQDFYRESH
jgi:putative glutamine amidotransferase